MKKYSFAIRLQAGLTVEAKDGATALEMVKAAFNDAQCNGGAWPNGDPVLFEATWLQRPDIWAIDGEERRVITLHDWETLKQEEAGK